MRSGDVYHSHVISQSSVDDGQGIVGNPHTDVSRAIWFDFSEAQALQTLFPCVGLPGSGFSLSARVHLGINCQAFLAASFHPG